MLGAESSLQAKAKGIDGWWEGKHKLRLLHILTACMQEMV